MTNTFAVHILLVFSFTLAEAQVVPTPPVRGQQPEFTPIIVSVPYFIGRPVEATWNEDNKTMKLNKDFTFVDATDYYWRAHAGMVTDGASIPRWAWTIIGSPFTGEYREAAVIHDAACISREKTWEETALMFYEAMLVDKTPPVKAKIMYAAVFYFGPRWITKRQVSAQITPDQTPDAVSVASLQRKIGATDSTPIIDNISIIHQAGPILRQLQVEFDPNPSPLREKDFRKLQKFIEDAEAVHPDSMTLEQIRAYRPRR